MPVFSMAAFQASAFQNDAFQIGSATTGRSGYWRLFYHNLQAQEMGEGPEADTKKPEAEVQKTQPEKKRKAKLEPLVPLETYEPIQFKRKVISFEREALQPSLQPLIDFVGTDLQRMYGEYQPLLVELLRQKALRERLAQEQLEREIKAANDAAYRIRLLLLSA